MKKAFYLLVLLVLPFTFISCGSDDDEPDFTTYTINYNVDAESGSILIDVTLFEYNDAGEKVATNTITDIKKGTSRKFNASSIASKVKVYLKMYASSNSSFTKYCWVQQVYYLENGKNISIDITGETMTGNKEP